MLMSLYHLKSCMSKNSTSLSCRISLTECSRSSFDLTVVCRFLSLSLSAMSLTVVNVKFNLWVLDFMLDPVVCVEHWRRVFTSRARWILLWRRVTRFRLKCYASINVLSFEASYKTRFELQSCNNLIFTLIMSLYTSYMCLYIFASSRIPWLILRR
jgi:hypothetical protein